MATHSIILTWWIPWAEEPSGLQFMGLQRVGHDWVTNTFLFLPVTWAMELHVVLDLSSFPIFISHTYIGHLLSHGHYKGERFLPSCFFSPVGEADKVYQWWQYSMVHPVIRYIEGYLGSEMTPSALIGRGWGEQLKVFWQVLPWPE